jgi:ribonuclease HII
MLLIATDEAGYGPKLGPLVIVATAWSIPGDGLQTKALTELFAPLRVPRRCGQSLVVVDDSKVVYRPSDGLASLHAVVSASLRWCGRPERTLRAILPQLLTEDLASIARTPWLDLAGETTMLNCSMTSELLRGWRESGIELIDVKARIITAEAFNAACAEGCNKADLLSQSSLKLVRRLVDVHGRHQTSIAVYCDRHGGRRYYAGILQHVFPDLRLQVIAETKQQSEYRLLDEESRMEVYFTVKGDTFTPVALSSMHAKYWRERFMESLNTYFAARHRGTTPLKPTAGYPVDADRFLADIQSILQREQIDPRKIVRSR